MRTGSWRSMEEVVVRGVSLERKQAKVTICGVPDEPGCAGENLLCDLSRKRERRM